MKIETITSIIEGNKCIAEFMGLEKKPNLMCANDLKWHYNKHTKEDVYGDLQYQTSWDWLMPVVEKIEALEEYMIEIELYSCYVIQASKLLEPENCFLCESHSDSKIKAVYEAVIEFLKWYKKHQSVQVSDATKVKQ